jgi:hypothetical protein
LEFTLWDIEHGVLIKLKQNSSEIEEALWGFEKLDTERLEKLYESKPPKYNHLKYPHTGR